MAAKKKPAKKATAPRKRASTSAKKAPAKKAATRKRAPAKKTQARKPPAARVKATTKMVDALEATIKARTAEGVELDGTRLASLRVMAENLDTQHDRYQRGLSDRPLSASLVKEFGAQLDHLGERGPDDDDPFAGLGGPPMGHTTTT